MIQAQILDVFVDDEGNFGGGLGVILDESRSISDAQRKLVTKQLGYEETIFINNIKANEVSIYTPEREIPFAGQPMVGAAWLLSQLQGKPPSEIRCLSGNIVTWQSSGLTWIRANLGVMPAWNIKQLPTVDAVDRLAISDAGSLPHTFAWAWASEREGLVRARTFAVDWGIPAEVQTNGSGSMLLASLVKRDIQIKHGLGSTIYAKSENGHFAAVGGRVVKWQVLDI